MWYILPIGGLYATYHLLGEPKTTIDLRYPQNTNCPTTRPNQVGRKYMARLCQRGEENIPITRLEVPRYPLYHDQHV